MPTISPITFEPSIHPSISPSESPSISPTTFKPTMEIIPTVSPTTERPTAEIISKIKGISSMTMKPTQNPNIIIQINGKTNINNDTNISQFNNENSKSTTVMIVIVTLD
eukprot:75503_1